MPSTDYTYKKYAQFTTGPGSMPQVCVDMWQKIWKMKPTELGEKMDYVADLEVYDKGAAYPQHTILDILIGMKCYRYGKNNLY
jgi:predicted transcriptional regulator YdeE